MNGLHRGEGVDASEITKKFPFLMFGFVFRLLFVSNPGNILRPGSSVGTNGQRFRPNRKSGTVDQVIQRVPDCDSFRGFPSWVLKKQRAAD